jgi:uncharacterized protein YneF (UPF0154 family)
MLVLIFLAFLAGTLYGSFGTWYVMREEIKDLKHEINFLDKSFNVSKE